MKYCGSAKTARIIVEPRNADGLLISVTVPANKKVLKLLMRNGVYTSQDVWYPPHSIVRVEFSEDLEGNTPKDN